MEPAPRSRGRLWSICEHILLRRWSDRRRPDPDRDDRHDGGSGYRVLSRGPPICPDGMYLLDTNVVSELRKAATGKADPNVAAWAGSVAPAEISLSAITILELEQSMARHRAARQSARCDPAAMAGRADDSRFRRTRRAAGHRRRPLLCSVARSEEHTSELQSL